MTATEPRRSPGAHPDQALALLTPALPPAKAVAASTSLGKAWPVLSSEPALPSKPLGTHRLNRDSSTQGHPFKNGTGNRFT